MSRSDINGSESVGRPRYILAKAPPSDDAFTPYDEQHFAVYLGLLHASADGLCEDEMCRTVLGVDPQTPGSKDTLRSHLARARWFSTTGYRHLLDC